MPTSCWHLTLVKFSIFHGTTRPCKPGANKKKSLQLCWAKKRWQKWLSWQWNTVNMCKPDNPLELGIKNHIRTYCSVNQIRLGFLLIDLQFWSTQWLFTWLCRKIKVSPKSHGVSSLTYDLNQNCYLREYNPFLNINLGSAYCSIVLTCCRATVYTRDQCSSFALSAPAMAPAMSKCPWRKVQGRKTPGKHWCHRNPIISYR